MSKWEFKRDRLPRYPRADASARAADAGASANLDSIAMHEEYLLGCSREGWELVTVLRDDDGDDTAYLYFFKRPHTD
jgi:hypothetical protein